MIKTCILLNIQTRGLNPLTPGSDSHVTSPYNIHLLCLSLYKGASVIVLLSTIRSMFFWLFKSDFWRYYQY